MEPKNAVTIIISTWDGYACAWPPLCHGFKKYWRDCPWSIRFTTNYLDPPCGEGLKLGEDTRDWSGRMRRTLGIVETPLLLYMSEDNWLCKKINTSALMDFANLILTKKANYIRLSKASPSRARCSFRLDKRLVVLTNDAKQRTSLQPALWRTNVFQSVLGRNETPWQFEGMAPHRSKKIPGFMALARGQRPFPYVGHVDPGWNIDPIRRGLWTKAARIYAKREGLDIDFTHQPETHLKCGRKAPRLR